MHVQLVQSDSIVDENNVLWLIYERYDVELIKRLGRLFSAPFAVAWLVFACQLGRFAKGPDGGQGRRRAKDWGGGEKCWGCGVSMAEIGVLAVVGMQVQW